VFNDPIAEAGTDTVICDATPVQIGADPLSYHDYLWTPSVGLSDATIANPLADVTETTEFVLRLTDQVSGCEDWDTVTVEFFAPPNLGSDAIMCEGDTVWLSVDYLPNFTQPVWNDGSTGTELMVTDSGTYWVQVDNQCGTFIDEIHIDAFDCNCEVMVPNVLNPNGDHMNDFFTPQFVCPLKEYELTIYNRWGSKVFNTNNPLEYWGGECKKVDCSAGTYYWVIKYTDVFDTHGEKAGYVTLLR
jgi:gliding motility-associated-like protein